MSFLFAPAAGRGTFPPSADGESSLLRVSEKLSARKGRTRLRQFARPGFPVQKRSRPERANTPAAVRVPRLSGAEKEPPVKANTLTQFAPPGQPVQKRSRPVRANPPAAVRAPR
ncbi:hypothetical protein DW088_11260 [Butyricicoccus sp. AM05-1]|nr:hypothetical protein DW088_11260 [Butyricicoccus sp. AM05-1]